jgi:hypothetical protein
MIGFLLGVWATVAVMVAVMLVGPYFHRPGEILLALFVAVFWPVFTVVAAVYALGRWILGE